MLSAAIFCMMTITPVLENNILEKLFMAPPIFKNKEENGEMMPDNFVEDDELDYLLKNEQAVVVGRDYFSWDPPQIKKEVSATSSSYTEDKGEVCQLPELDLFGLDEDVPSALLEPEKEGTIPYNDFDEIVDVKSDDGVDGESYSFAEGYYPPQEAVDLDPLDDIDEPNWLELAAEVEEFDPDITSDLLDVEIGGSVTREDRALQAAMDIGDCFALAEKEIRTIAWIFSENGWSACKVAVTRELESGTTIADLQLAAEIKGVWQEHYEFYSGQSSNYRILSWPTALKLVNGFDGYPEVEEIEQLLIGIHSHWKNSSSQRRIFKSFNECLIAYLNEAEGGLDFSIEWVLTQESMRTEDIFLPPSSTDIPLIHDYELERALRTIRLREFSLI